MTVQDLIKELNEVDNKEMTVLISFDMGMATDGIQGLHIDTAREYVLVLSVN